MVGTHSFLTRLRGVLKSLDDDALAALANKGLLRRALKDLEAARPSIVDADECRVRLQVAEATVEIPEIPSSSACSCPATGVCRHVLTALLYLRDDPELAAFDAAVQQSLLSPEDGAADETGAGLAVTLAAPAEVIGSLGDEDLQKWCGKALFKRALKALAIHPQVEIEDGPALVVRFPTRNIVCRWIPSSGPQGMMCSCQAQTVCEHVVAAVLAYQVSLGKRRIESEQMAPAESSGAPRTRAEVLASVATVAREIVSLGITRLSVATKQRLTTLAVSAHGVDLPRLERLLKSLVDEIKLALGRDAQSSSAGILAQASRVEALRVALERHATSALVGRHRTQYYDVGQITLVGLGAQRWRSKGGYQGVTVYFWDESRSAWATWTESRPVQQPGFDPSKRFFEDGPWPGSSSPKEASRSILRISGAWRNLQGRISGRAASRALVVGPSKAGAIPGTITRWTTLAERAQKLFGGGLGEPAENLDLVLLAPKTWGQPLYDSLRQELLRPVLDEQGRATLLWLPFTPENEKAVDRLEQLDTVETTGLLGAIRLVAGQLRIQPISLFVGDRILHLDFDEQAGAVPRNIGPQMIAATSDEDELLPDDRAEDAIQPSAATPLGRLLITAQAEVEALAESGIMVRRNLDLLTSAAKRLETLGLTSCSRPMLRLAAELGSATKLAQPNHVNQVAGTLLHTYYTLRLAADQETIAAACEGLR